MRKIVMHLMPAAMPGSPGSIGGAELSGCLRMMNGEVIDLQDRVKTGARV